MQLPYYIDGDVKLTQSLAIIRYLARKHNLNGVNEQEKIRIDQFEQQLVDNNTAFVMMNYAFGGDFGKLKIDYLNGLPQTLKLLSDFLGEHQYFAGDNLSYVDFLAYEFIDKHIMFAGDVVKQFNNLIEFHSRFEKLPNIDKYIKSDQFLKWPINADMAKWGSRLNQNILIIN